MKAFQRILVHLDNGPAADTAVRHAARVARASGASIRLIHVPEELPRYAEWVFPAVKHAWSRSEEKTRTDLGRITNALRDEGLDASFDVLHGHRVLEILREALGGHYDLLVKTDDVDRPPRDMKIFRKCTCPVWMVRPEVNETGGRRVVAAVDPEVEDTEKTRLAVRVLDLAASVARMEDAELHVLHAWTVFGENLLGEGRMEEYAQAMKQMAERGMENLLASRPWAASPEDIRLIKGDPAQVLPEYIASVGASLVVMGTIGRSGIPGLLMGNTAESVLCRIRCSVLAIKPEGFISPVAS